MMLYHWQLLPICLSPYSTQQFPHVFASSGWWLHAGDVIGCSALLLSNRLQMSGWRQSGNTDFIQIDLLL